jgi:hypothetical protein
MIDTKILRKKQKARELLARALSNALSKDDLGFNHHDDHRRDHVHLFLFQKRRKLPF